MGSELLSVLITLQILDCELIIVSFEMVSFSKTNSVGHKT